MISDKKVKQNIVWLALIAALLTIIVTITLIIGSKQRREYYELARPAQLHDTDIAFIDSLDKY